MAKELKKREDIDKKYKWDIEAMYPDEADWEKDLKECTEMAESFKRFQGKLAESADTLLEALKAKDELWLKLEHAYVYAAMKKDEDNRVAKYIGMNDKIGAVLAKVGAEMSFFTPELLSASEETILGYIDENEGLKQYEFALKDALREKLHILTDSEERLLAQMNEVLDASSDIFKMLNNVDMDFGTVVDNNNETVKLTHGSYIPMMKDQNPEIRKAAYMGMYNEFKEHINTIATTYNYSVKTDVVKARIRNYGSAREAALSNFNIPESVYDNLIDVVHEYLPVMYKYTSLRKKILGVDELKMHDIYVPLVKLQKRDYSYEDALELAVEGLQPMGEEYLEQFVKGTQDGWIDVYENKGKTSGAYSFGAYDSKPYVLLNFSGNLDDVFTIVHEMGHSMHSWYTRTNQPFTYGDYPIFTAEVASTVNESLLIQYMIDKEADPEIKKYLINHYIEEFRTTLFRQTMFAEFEMLTHKEIEDGGALTAEWLCSKYNELNNLYFGPALTEDDMIQYEWARIPHFYRAFYVYQYATGYSAATAISKKILTEGETARNNYISFLKSGSSDYPVELLKIAGVDMSSPEPVRLAMETFRELVDQLENLLS